MSRIRFKNGRVRIRFKNAWKDGTHSVLLDPLDFISRLCALIPSPRFHMLRYHGVLAGHSRDRAEVIPRQKTKDESSPMGDAQQLLFEPAPPLQPPPPSRHPWAWLLRRVVAIDIDIMTCPRCQSAMRVVAVATEADDIRAALGTATHALKRRRCDSLSSTSPALERRPMHLCVGGVGWSRLKRKSGADSRLWGRL